MQPSTGLVAGVETQHRSIAAPVVVDAAGAWVRHVAELAGARVPVTEHRGGLFTMSPDGRFVVGPVPDLPGLWVASGCNGSGFSSALALGEALAAWITCGTPPPGLTALAPGRFGPLSDGALLSRGLWQYAHYYDPAPADGPVRLER